MTNNKNSTRYYSDRHEKRTAKNIGAKVQTSSGSSSFLKGDVISTKCLIECKTSTSGKKSFSIKKEIPFTIGFLGSNFWKNILLFLIKREKLLVIILKFCLRNLIGKFLYLFLLFV
jgi:hypothetical protein